MTHPSIGKLTLRARSMRAGARSTVAIAWVIGALSGAPSVAQASVVDRVVAVVEDQIVLQSEVELERTLAQLDDSPSPFWDLSEDPMERLISAAVLRQSAGDVQLYQPDDSSIATRLEAIRGKFVDRKSWLAFLAEYGMDEERLRFVLRRRMVVERFLDRNLAVDVSNHKQWIVDATAMLERLRPRMRVRIVPEMSE